MRKELWKITEIDNYNTKKCEEESWNLENNLGIRDAIRPIKIIEHAEKDEKKKFDEAIEKINDAITKIKRAHTKEVGIDLNKRQLNLSNH